MVRIVEEGWDRIGEYARVPIAFHLCSRADLDALRRGSIVEIPATPRRKDYDEFAEERPTSLPARFDVSNWQVFAAFLGERRVGGTIVTRDCPEFDMLEGRRDLAVLADIRVAPRARGRGVGRALLAAAEDWARRHGCVEMKVETQDVNVSACRFYLASGFVLAEVNPDAYGPEFDEVQLIWRKAL
jgi:GNAT superfamily N-acetyltransferase